MEHKAVAEVLFNSGYNCAQAVVAAFCDVTELDREVALKLSSSFGAGMGKMREVCGACTGAFAVAGMLWGYSDPADDNAKSAHYELIRRIADDFKAKHGTVICRDLLRGLQNINTSEPAKRTAEYYAVRPCCRFVADAAEIIDKIIAERSERE